MLAHCDTALGLDDDHAALVAACNDGVGLCTIVGIDGSFSRRLGAQLAILPDGSTVGSMADGCLEAQLAADLKRCRKPKVVRYGRGSCNIDFRLPCGGGLDILLDPTPDRRACRSALARLKQRHPASLELAHEGEFRRRMYIPALRVIALGEGPELASFTELCEAASVDALCVPKDDLTLGRVLDTARYDAWTACLLLFHDHEWEAPLLEQALTGGAFYIGAQGGERARHNRALAMLARGVDEGALARITSPVGLIPNCKSPTALALSALAEIVGEYERMHAAA